jgi:hypothetical protein
MNSADIVSCVANTAAYYGWCNMVHIFCDVFATRVFPSLKSSPKNIQCGVSNRGVAALHAMTMFVMTAYYWRYLNPTMTMGTHMSNFQGLCIDVMNGYMVYDTLNEMSTNMETDVMVHHVMGLITHFVARYLDSGMSAYFFNLVYLAEASTPIVHLSWLLYHLKATDTVLFKFSVASLLLVFFCCRVLLCPYMDHQLYVSYYETAPEGLLWKGQEAMFYLNVVIMFFFTLLNYYWFYKLVGTAMKAMKKGAKIAEAE